MAAIDISGVEYRYGDHKAVDGISLTVEKGEFFALLGPNGAGKTTLLNMLMTVTHPSAGHITIMGYDAITETSQVRCFAGAAERRAC